MTGVVVTPIQTSDGTPVAASPQWTLGQIAFTRTDDGTEKMNVDGGAGGTPVVLWNGTGGADTGGDWSRSGEGSETTAAAKSGTNGLDTGVTSENDTSVFDNGSELDIDGTYDQLEFWMAPQAFPTASRLRLLWRNGSNTQVGDGLLVNGYVGNFDLGVWQKVTIPIADFNLTGDVQKLVLRYVNTSGQRYYFDDIKLVAASGGGPYRFRVAAPDANTVWHLEELVVNLAEENGTWSASDFCTITDGLVNGLVIRHRQLSTSTVLWAINIKDNLDLFGRLHPTADIEYGVGTNEHQFRLVLTPKLSVVRVTNDDVLEVVVRDDLSTINGLRAYIQYAEEVIA